MDPLVNESFFELKRHMNLPLARQLLIAADEQPYGFLRVRGREVAHEVQLLAEAGLVEASAAADDSSSAVIKCVTDAGHTFLRAFKGESAHNLVQPAYAHSMS